MRTREIDIVSRSSTSSSSPSWPGRSSRIFSASSACRLPNTPGTGPSTPASAQLPTSPSRVASGHTQRRQAPLRSGRTTWSWPSYWYTLEKIDRLAQAHAHIVQQELGAEVVRAVDDEIVLR